MLVEMDKRMLSSLIRGCDPAYEIMGHPLIKSKGYYSGGHNDKWNWNNSFGDCTEEQLWETYQLLKNPVSYKAVRRDGPCSVDTLYAKLSTLKGVTDVRVEDHNDFSVSITVVGGSDEDIGRVLANNLPVGCLTRGDYQVYTLLESMMFYRIYRELQ